MTLSGVAILCAYHGHNIAKSSHALIIHHTDTLAQCTAASGGPQREIAMDAMSKQLGR